MNLVFAALTAFLATSAAGVPQDPANTYLMIGAILTATTIALGFLELVVPSGGLIAVVAGICAVGSVICFFTYDTTLGAASVLAYLVLGPIAIVYGLKVWMNSRMMDFMVLGGRDAIQDRETDEPIVEDRNADLRALIGTEGVTATVLRPVGVVVIEGRRVNALAEAGAIEVDVPVIVCDVYDNQIKVRPTES